MTNIPEPIRQAILNTTRTHEGGYVNDPDDPGGETRYGISKRSYPRENIAALTMERAVEIYWRDWWNGSMKWLLAVKNQEVAAKIFDIGINVGPGRIGRLVQQALLRCKEPVAIDGIVGPRTLEALNDIPPDWFLAEFRAVCASYYRDLADKNPVMVKYLKGWLNRAYA